jgi:allophanate hydrolase
MYKSKISSPERALRVDRRSFLKLAGGAVGGALALDALGSAIGARPAAGPRQASEANMEGQRIASYAETGIQTLLAKYRAEALTPTELCEDILQRIARNDETDQNPILIYQVPPEEVLARCAELEAQKAELGEQWLAALPLYGIPFVIKDNMDVEGLPTSAGSRSYTHTAEVTGTIMQKALDAGAILIGKANLDQFATGLVGVRSEYGACRNPRNQEYITGGSSSGSAVAVALGWASFSYGTDTAGSGRVPAAFNHLVGYKGTRGLISTHGTLPAVQSIDCNTIFTLTSADARYVAEVIRGYDPKDPFSREPASTVALWDPLFSTNPPTPYAPAFRFGVPADAEAMEFFGDEAARQLYHDAIDRLEQMGGIRVEFDYTPWKEAADLLYGGPWVAERTAAVGEYVAAHEEEVMPTTFRIITGGFKKTAVEAYKANYRLHEIKQITNQDWQKFDVMILPTTGTIYKIAELEASVEAGIELNTNLGRYTNFANLLDTCAIALPAGFRPADQKDGMPAGITLFANTWNDGKLFALAQRYEFALMQG